MREVRPGFLEQKTYEKAPEPPPTSSMRVTPSKERRLTRALADVDATSGSENQSAYEGATPVVITSGSAPMR